MWVIKLGGSLQDSLYLHPWLETIVTHGAGRVVLIPGGGRFADRVRREQDQYRFDDNEAHARAIGAMEEYAAFLCARAPQLLPVQDEKAILQGLDNHRVPVWLPSAMVIDNPDLPASWEVTSDSLALWLAQRLPSRGLALIKSVALDEADSWEGLASAGAIDAFFPVLLRRRAVNLVWYTGPQYQQLPGLLEAG